MTLNKKLGLLIVAAFALCCTSVSARAQETKGKIVIKASTAPAEGTKPTRARFEVLHMMINAIQVRSLANEREIHTFIYSDQIRDQMQAMFNNAGYQYGDKILIDYMPGSEIALRIKGKPSKPI